MAPFTHVPGAVYRIMDGVRRAKAAHMHGHLEIRAEVVDPSGQSLGEGMIPLAALRSPKPLIRRITPADERRWRRVIAGAQQADLPYPVVIIQPGGEHGTTIEKVAFDFGVNP